MNKKVTIIIPLPRFNDYIREAIPYYEKLDYSEFDIIILPDEIEEEKLSDKLDMRSIPSGKVGPAEKRDMGAKEAEGEIIAFTDDDAFPDKNWLKNAVAVFKDESVGAVGGPAVTPENDGFWQKISGNIYESFFMSGHYRRRYIPHGKITEDFDLPSVNLLIRKDAFFQAGGFDSTFYPGEDTKLCLEIKKLGYKIIYNPKAFVHHHRRNLRTHFKQITNYAYHRGYFAKRYPETSLKIFYFIPSIFLVSIVFGWAAIFLSPVLFNIYLGGIGLYFLLNLIFNFKINPIVYFFTVTGVFLSHLAYGLFFIKGLLTKNIKR